MADNGLTTPQTSHLKVRIQDLALSCFLAQQTLLHYIFLYPGPSSLKGPLNAPYALLLPSSLQNACHASWKFSFLSTPLHVHVNSGIIFLFFMLQWKMYKETSEFQINVHVSTILLSFLAGVTCQPTFTLAKHFDYLPLVSFQTNQESIVPNASTPTSAFLTSWKEGVD